VDAPSITRCKRTDVPGAWVFNQPFYLILNVAVGGTSWDHRTRRRGFPQVMLVDWVRVYERGQ
jgi:hypothetical protein